jgi:alkanesulfonate monooxygenase SsuD/methylene tetrahydromethanopterin reductase-like flavin-dependent oxidoreductase (luciferase family)
MLDAFGVVGTPDECARKIGEFARAGVKLPILFALGGDAKMVIEAGKRYAAS